MVLRERGDRRWLRIGHRTRRSPPHDGHGCASPGSSTSQPPDPAPGWEDDAATSRTVRFPARGVDRAASQRPGRGSTAPGRGRRQQVEGAHATRRGDNAVVAAIDQLRLLASGTAGSPFCAAHAAGSARGRRDPPAVAGSAGYSIRSPDIARAMTSCWISDVDSKIVWFRVSESAQAVWCCLMPLTSVQARFALASCLVMARPAVCRDASGAGDPARLPGCGGTALHVLARSAPSRIRHASKIEPRSACPPLWPRW